VQERALALRAARVHAAGNFRKGLRRDVTREFVRIVAQPRQYVGDRDRQSADSRQHSAGFLVREP
jgi:hypothetical protein